MNVALIGMSGMGKSHHSAALAARGFVHHDIDAEIAAHVPDLVEALPGERPVETVGRWMGMPWMPGRAEREGQYLALEAKITRAAIEAAEEGDHVIDTTGSVIYLEDALLDRLRERARVVYLRAPQDRVDAMLARYLREPKPVVWGAVWAPRQGESNDAALRRLYPQLLAWRATRYEALAHLSLAAEGLTTEALLAALG